MKKIIFLTLLPALLVAASLCMVLSQTQLPSYSELVKQYATAQAFYDQATNVNSREVYGPAEEALERQWNEKALEGFTAVYKQLPGSAVHYDSLRFFLSFKLGELHHYFENFSNAILHYREAISVQEKTALPDSLLFKPYLYAGLIFYHQNKFDTAAQFFKKAEDIQLRYGNALSEAERLFNILGVLYYDRGNYRQAQNYIQKALSILPATHPYYDDLSVNYKINLAQLHLRLEEYEKANAIYQELLPKNINLNEINHNIGTLNLSLGAAAKAIHYFRKVAYQNNKIVRLNNSIGEAFFNLNQLDSALHYYKKAIAAHTRLGQNGDKIGYGLTLKNVGDYQLRKGEKQEALQQYQQAIRQFYPSFQQQDVHVNPDTFSGIFSYIHLFTALKAKAECWHAIYTASNRLEDAQQELAAYRSAFALIAYVERTYDSDEARLFLAKTKHAVHGKPIDIAFDLYGKTANRSYLEELYYFDQQNKAAVLSLTRQLNSNFSDAAASPELKKERQIREEITRLSIRAAQLTDSAQLAALQTRIRDSEIALSKLQDNFSLEPTGSPSIPSLQFLQKNLLDDETLLLSYHLADDRLTILSISQKNVQCQQRSLPPDFTSRILAAIAARKDASANSEPETEHFLYDLLLPEKTVQQFKKLVIVPDDVLSYFPFESLQRDGHYLIEKLAVQYQFSTALLEINTTNFSESRTLSFAPFANVGYGDSLPRLPASATEVATARGQQLMGAAATKGEFLKSSNRYGILHLATHAVASEDSNGLSFIVFSPTANRDHLLYTQEIYNLNLTKTDLLILSACETGTGRLAKGEGILSLSRAFAYAGCSNIITTLWKADDYSTAYLTSRVHYHLQNGLAIAEALQKAKKEYLADGTIHPRLKKPYYWSHLVFVGNYQPAAGSRWPWIGGIIGVGLVIIWLVRRRRR